MKLPTTRISFWDLIGFLFGHRGSIWRLIHSPGAIWFAAALVATAAMAREYDAVSLWHQPADLLAPFAASVLLASVLFLWVWATAAALRIRIRRPGQTYVVFLTGYWLTAPLAWLYAIPIEEFADEITAMRFNLTMLSIVSVWRVLLFTRVVSIQFGIPFLVVLFTLLVPCMAVAFMGVFSAMLDLVGIMGGVRLTQTQEVMKNFSNGVLTIISTAFLPVVLLAIVAIVMGRRKTRQHQSPASSDSLPRILWGVPVLASIGFGVAMLFFQPALIRAARIDQLLQTDRIDEAIALMSQTTADGLPTTWDPPPKATDRYEIKPSITQLLESIEETDPSPWITQRLLTQADMIAPRECDLRYGFQARDTDEPRTIFGSIEQLQNLSGIIDRLLNVDAIDDGLRDRLSDLQKTVDDSRDAALERQRKREEAENEDHTQDERGLFNISGCGSLIRFDFVPKSRSDGMYHAMDVSPWFAYHRTQFPGLTSGASGGLTKGWCFGRET